MVNIIHWFNEIMKTMMLKEISQLRFIEKLWLKEYVYEHMKCNLAVFFTK